jgi:hypothetical protein
MKKPRDILFARHQAAAPKLDAIRQSAVAAVYDRHASTKMPPTNGGHRPPLQQPC